jgi:glycine/D-amino acid oxidase-like deaminating enzyme/nitrite reductase/ring-hydroxylating ferredoxin subunit
MPDSGRTTSLWHAEATLPDVQSLDGDARCDVCVIGAGISGLTTAYLLARQGRSVLVLDDGPVGGGATLRTTAHLSNALDDRYYRLEHWHGENGARLAAASHAAAIEQIATIVATERIDCDFRRVDGYLVQGDPAGDGEELQRELEAAQRAGLDVALGRLPYEGYDFGPALRFAGQARFHPGHYLGGLARAAEALGVRIASPAHMSAIESESDVAAVVRTEAGAQVHCGAVVVATNTPVNDRLRIHTKQAAYRTYVIAARLPEGRAPDALLWDTCDPYHYVRLQPTDDGGGDWLIVGGEDHKTGQPDEEEAQAPFEALMQWTLARFPGVGRAQYRWSGQVLEPHDGLAFIGRNPMDAPNIYIATGDSGNGLTHGTLAGLLLSELIAGREHPWATLYDPSRKSLRAAATFVRENANFAAQYRDLLLPGEIRDAHELARGEGAIVRRGLTKHALYRDAQGGLHEMSALCPHLGCAVRWNTTEKTWDCPCHGSRFAAEDGRVLNGPANRALSPVEHDDRRAS